MKRTTASGWLALASSACAAATVQSSPSGDRLYVANQDDASVSIIDIESTALIGTLDLTQFGFGPNAKPHHVVVEPNGSFWYVSLIAENRVLKLDADNRLVASTPFEAPGLLALHPTEDVLYVGHSMAAVNPSARIGIIRRSDMSIEEVGVFFPRPHALAVTPGGERVFVASLAVNRIASLDPDGEGLELLDVQGERTHVIVQFAVSPNGRSLVSTGEMTGILMVYDLTDSANPRPVTEVAVGERPWHPAFTPDGRWVWLANKGSNTVSVVDAQRWVVDTTIEGLGLDLPHGLAISPDGARVFVSSNGGGGRTGTLVVIDAERREILDVLEVGRYAAGLGVRPPQ